MAMSMRQQEVNFVCNSCGRGVNFHNRLHQCPHCKQILEWNRVEMVYVDKYLEIYEVRV